MQTSSLNSILYPAFQATPIATAIYNTSITPSHLPWNTYNYCNAPHVNADNYSLSHPSDSSVTSLAFVVMIMRHHKRTPDNLYPSEGSLNPHGGWDCSDVWTHSYAGPEVPYVYTQTSTLADHPFAERMWAGTCDAGQMTRAGLEDAVRHGQDFWGVYHSKLGFLEHVSPEEIYIRTSNEARTHHVAGAMLYGMDPNTAGRHWPVHTQPANIDSLVPSYVCPAAGNLRAAIQATPEWKDHLVRYESLQRRLDETLGTSGMKDWNSWYDHFFDSFTARTCHGHPLPCNTSGACITPEDAETVFAIGDWECNYIFNAAPQAHEYVQLTFGVFFAELVHTFQSLPSLWQWNGSPMSHVASGTEDDIRSGSAIVSNPSTKRNASSASGADTASKHKVHMYVGHDGSMVRLAAGLGLGRTTGSLRWPAMGSEIIMEVWLATTADDNDQPFVRVLHEGSPVPPPLDWIPLDEFVRLLEHIVPHDLKGACMEVE